MRTQRALVVVAVGLTAASLSLLTTDAVESADTQQPDASGQLFVDAVDAETGAPVPVRVTMAKNGLFATPRSAIGAHGQVRTSLAPGTYQLTVTHGPEWSFDQRTLTVTAGKTTRLAVPLTRLVDGAAYTACDLHVHTDQSPDSDLTVIERAHTLAAEDIQFTVITDHNRVTDAAAALASVGIASLPGVEVTTWAPEFGHFNVFPRTTAPRYTGSSPAALLRELRAHTRPFVQVNHPRLERHIGYFELASFDRTGPVHDERTFPLQFDAIEVWNGYDLSAPSRRDDVFQDWLALLARGARITATGNSDTHRAGVPPYAGYPRTYVNVPRVRARNTESVLRALEEGRSFVSNGPLIMLSARGLGPGDTLQRAPHEREVEVAVTVEAPSYMELDELTVWADRQRVARVMLDPRSDVTAHTRVMRIGLAHAHALLATVSGRGSLRALLGGTDATPFAFTNPLWVAPP